MEFFLGDALGSIRQLTDATGALTLTRSFDPYGNVISSEGTASSLYGFDAGQTDGHFNGQDVPQPPGPGRLSDRTRLQGVP